LLAAIASAAARSNPRGLPQALKQEAVLRLGESGQLIEADELKRRSLVPETYPARFPDSRT
jgi:hypothetical protein